jgi:hypothetical protein
MNACPKCNKENPDTAKFCGKCGHVFMAGGVKYPGAGTPSPDKTYMPSGPSGPSGAPGASAKTYMPRGGGNMQRTELGDSVSDGTPGGSGLQIGGAATVQETHSSIGPAAGYQGGGGPRTQLAEEESKPIAGWLVVMRSRSMDAYMDIPVFEGRNILGRDPGRGPHYLQDPNASEEHLLLVAKNGAVRATDLGSSNGTLVNNELIDATVLKRGDMVRIGKTVMVFVPMPDAA